jgi:hypothetical protein
VRPSITLRLLADSDPCNCIADPTPLVASLLTVKVALSQVNVIPHLGPTPLTSDVTTWNIYPKPPLRGADTSDATNARPAVNFSSRLRSTSGRRHTRHGVHCLGRQLHPSPRLTPVTRLLFYTGMQHSAPTRPPSDPEPVNLLSIHTSSAPPPHDYPPSVCPTEPLSGLTLPQPGKHTPHALDTGNGGASHA